MALAFLNGMDDQMSSANQIGAATAVFDTTVSRTGTASLRCTNTNSNGYWFVPIPGGGDATVVVGNALYYSNATATTMIAAFFSDGGSTYHVWVAFVPSTGVLSVYRGNPASGGVLLGSATLAGAALLINTWGYWETKCVLSDTVGRVTVRYNETVVLDLTGQDTRNAGTKSVIDSVGYPEMYPSGNNVYVDDLYVVTGTGTPNDFLGDCKVQTLYPTGNGDFSQLVGSDADSVNNYLLVNEAGAPNTANYVESSTVGQRDFYAMGDLATTPAVDVYGVQVTAYCNNPDAGLTRQVKLGVRQGTSEALSAAQPMTAVSFLAERGVFTTDPATGTFWTVAGVNNVQAGIEVA